MGGGCGGCQFHCFPYKAHPPIAIDGKRELKIFNAVDDVWDVIDLLIEEVLEANKSGRGFDVSKSINAQIPFFTCPNHLLSKDIQRDIQRYIYCIDTSTPAYNGSFGEQPAIWIERFFYMKRAFAKKEESQINKVKAENKAR